ncbi:MlaD family protein [Allohahella marinimesophila]|uniref:Mce/MlaD domain-containing protein n=1 Tax=Allohahella marinimesophila TaxID=1054972 RepID=A0ABP7NTA0_9GAMM
MEREARYVLIGLLLVVSIALSVVFVIWSANSGENEDAVRYKIFFSESISGLSKGSSVRFLGVPVGSVTAFSIGRLGDIDATARTANADGANDTGVIVEIAVQKRVDVTAGTVARLQTNGLTGRATIELQSRRVGSDSDASFEGVIPGKASSLGQLTDQLPDIAENIGETFERIERLLSDQVIEDTQATLSQLRETSGQFDKVSRLLENLIQEVRVTNSQVQDMVPRYIALADDMNNKTLPAVRESAVRMQATAGLISQQMTDNSSAFRGFIGDSRQSMEIIRDQMIQTSEKVREFTDELRENPSRLVYKQREYGVSFDDEE